jgi:hypothetical protein
MTVSKTRYFKHFHHGSIPFAFGMAGTGLEP